MNASNNRTGETSPAYSLTVPEPVYPPQEDTELLLSVIHGYRPEGTVLDMGTGSGVLAVAAAETAEHVVAVDINEEAVATAQENADQNDADNIAVVRSDLFTNVDNVFDVVVFNAPYIPVDEDIAGSEAWSGGETGRDVIEPFLHEVGDHLAPDGIIFLLISSRTGLDETRQLAADNGFTAEVAAEEKLPWETLYVLRIR